jgi:hypothetical protein
MGQIKGKTDKRNGRTNVKQVQRGLGFDSKSVLKVSTIDGDDAEQCDAGDNARKHRAQQSSGFSISDLESFFPPSHNFFPALGGGLEGTKLVTLFGSASMATEWEGPSLEELRIPETLGS